MSDLDWDLLSSYAGLLTLASGCIYAGSFGSLPNPKRPDGASEGEDEDDEDDSERMSSDDAWLFPVLGSVVLFGLYLIVKYFGKEWINRLLGWYFSVAGVGSVWKSSISLTRFVLGNARWKQFDTSNVSFKKGSSTLLSFSWKTPSAYLFPLAATPSIIYTFFSGSRKSVLITDILSISFSYNALSLLKIDSFKTGTILLSGLFVYDVWWVFGTEVMVKVATTLDVPIKLLWPKSLILSHIRGFTMLGLGDIVIPGTFVALALRYDHHRFLKAGQQGSSFSKPYFYASLVAYISGLVVTMAVMHVFGKAQPALLYLSPACILSFFATAALRGELHEAWQWNDDPEAAKLTDDASRSVEKITKGDSDSSLKADNDGNTAVESLGKATLKSRKRKNKAP